MDDDIQEMERRLRDMKAAKKAAMKKSKEAPPDFTPPPAPTLDIDDKPKPMKSPVQSKSWLRPRDWGQKWRWRRRGTALLINMELITGNHRSFLVRASADGFLYAGGQYIFDNISAYYDVDFKVWCYDYHQAFSLPLTRKVPVESVRDAVGAISDADIEYSTNPRTLKEFIVSKIAEGIMKGQQIDEFLRGVRMMVIIIMIASLLHLILWMNNVGMFKAMMNTVGG